MDEPPRAGTGADPAGPDTDESTVEAAQPTEASRPVESPQGADNATGDVDSDLHDVG